MEEWEKIAESFDRTRQLPWKECINFINSLPEGNTVLDLGCGNGRHLIPCAERCRKVIGIDLSINLLNIVRKKLNKAKIGNAELIRADAKNLPIKSEVFDSALFIAALHNIQGRKNRIEALKELKRVLKANGKSLITVWSRWNRWKKHFLRELLAFPIYLFKKKELKEFGDIIIPWKGNGMDVPRFYHLYAKREFERDVRRSGLAIESISHVGENFFLIARK
jgi:alkylated DNA repair protein alkB family protein 8